jgi:uncharacterized protein (TIGR03437 family)
MVRDQSGVEADASLLYVSAGQINFVLPGGATAGNAVVKVMRDNQLAGAAQIVLASVAPGLFTANSQATGPAAAMAVYVAADGSQTVARRHIHAAPRETVARRRFPSSPTGRELTCPCTEQASAGSVLWPG